MGWEQALDAKGPELTHVTTGASNHVKSDPWAE